MVTAFHFLEKDFHLQMILVHIPGQPPNVDLRRLERMKIYNQFKEHNIQQGLEMESDLPKKFKPNGNSPEALGFSSSLHSCSSSSPQTWNELLLCDRQTLTGRDDRRTWIALLGWSKKVKETWVHLASFRVYHHHYNEFMNL